MAAWNISFIMVEYSADSFGMGIEKNCSFLCPKASLDSAKMEWVLVHKGAAAKPHRELKDYLPEWVSFQVFKKIGDG